MKDFLLIDSGLSNNFWAKVIEICNYLQNKLLLKSWNYGKLISKKAWTNQKQNLAHIYIFNSLLFVDILYKKISKSDF